MSAEFTKEMKATHTILAPDIFPTHMELLKEIFKMYGYNLQVLKTTGKAVIDAGLQHLHNDMCYPAICAIGQQLYALKKQVEMVWKFKLPMPMVYLVVF